MRYLAERARRKELLESKRRERDLRKQEEERAAKKARLDLDRRAANEIQAVKRRALGILELQLAATGIEKLDERDLAQLSAAQKTDNEKDQLVEEAARKRNERRKTRLEDGAFADDWDNRVVVGG